MKKTIAILFLCFSAICMNAQWLDSDVYDRPLKDVLDEVEVRYGISLEYKEKTVQGLVVKSAPWRYAADAATTLDNILIPLDLRKVDKGKGRFEIKKWEYYRQSDAEGAAQLEALWKSYGNLQAWEQRKEAVRNNIFEVLSIDRFPKGEIHTIETKVRKYKHYTVQNIGLEILPGVWVCGSLYRPAKSRGQLPLMLCPHGHFYNKEDNSIPNERGRYRPDQQLRCATLAMMGCAVFSYDMWAWGESALAFKLKDHRSDLGLIMQTWQSIRILDWLCAQKWADTSRIGVTGASGGGTQTMIIAAIDARITLSVPVVMTSSHFYGGCPCESGLPIHILKDAQRSNNAELAAMVAPRAQLVISDGHDWTSSLPEIEFPYLQKVYGLYGAEGNVENAHFAKEGHDYGPSKRNAMYEFVARKWGLKSASEDNCTIEEAGQMYVFGGVLPEGAVKGSDNLRIMLKQY